jgi:hypothetical protein
MKLFVYLDEGCEACLGESHDGVSCRLRPGLHCSVPTPDRCPLREANYTLCGIIGAPSKPIEPLSEPTPSLSTSETEPPLESLPALKWSCTECGRAWEQFGKDNQPKGDCPDCGSRFARFTGLEEIADGNGR